jgi:hypothetical protein
MSYESAIAHPVLTPVPAAILIIISKISFFITTNYHELIKLAFMGAECPRDHPSPALPPGEGAKRPPLLWRGVGGEVIWCDGDVPRGIMVGAHLRVRPHR